MGWKKEGEINCREKKSLKKRGRSGRIIFPSPYK
jgi:hypothetical protein